MGLFDKRLNYKPFEYPEILQFTEAINRSFWVHSEVDLPRIHRIFIPIYYPLKEVL